MSATRLLIIPGSVRSGSLNLKLAQAAARLADAAGLQPAIFDLRELALPVYDGDLEAEHGLPENILKLHTALQESDAVLFVTPEYNGFPTPLMINAMDWLSRVTATDARPNGLAVTTNKPAALLSASPGALGGLRSMTFLRQYLQMMFAMLVVPQQFALGQANAAFDEQGDLLDARATQSVNKVIKAVDELAQSLRK